MDEESKKMKELIKRATEVAETAPEKFQSEAFKVVFEILMSKSNYKPLDSGSSVGTSHHDLVSNGTNIVRLSQLSSTCEISEQEIKNVIKIKDKSISLVYHLKEQKTSFRQIVGSLITLLSHNALFNEDHVSSQTLKTTLTISGIQDPGNNLSTNLKSRSDIFIFDPSSREYSLNTGLGMIMAKKIFNKLAKGLQVIEEDLNSE